MKKAKNNKTVIDVKGYTPYLWQKAVHTILKENSKKANLMVVIKAKRQVGKSIMLENILLEKAITSNGSTSILLTPTLKQSRKVYKDIIKAIEHTPLIKKKNETLLELQLLNNSEIIFISAEQKENLRGYTADLLCIDEAAYISDDVFGIVMPFCNVKKAPIVICSTPKFKTGMFYKFYSMGGTGNIFTVDFNNYDTSIMLSNEMLEIYRQTLPKLQFQTDYLGLFADLNSELFGDVSKLINNKPFYNNNYYIGIDWGTGQGKDYTAISVFNSLGQMIHLNQWNDLDETQTITKIAEIIEEYKPIKVSVEFNSIGSIFYSLLKQKLPNINIQKFITTNESKNNLVRTLQLGIQNKQISFLTNQTLFQQMAIYQIQQTKTGKTTFNAANGYNDDLLFATMLAYKLTMNNNNYTIL